MPRAPDSCPGPTGTSGARERGNSRFAEDEPNRGRPIPIKVKVKETMEECGAAILIFSADEELFDKDGNSVWRPSENVVNELGAASIMYDSRIIISARTR